MVPDGAEELLRDDSAQASGLFITDEVRAAGKRHAVVAGIDIPSSTLRSFPLPDESEGRIYRTGVEAEVVLAEQRPANLSQSGVTATSAPRYELVVRGLRRCRVVEPPHLQDGRRLGAHYAATISASTLPDRADEPATNDASATSATTSAVLDFTQLLTTYTKELRESGASTSSPGQKEIMDALKRSTPGRAADLIVSSIESSVEELQALLETSDLADRLQLAVALIRYKVEAASVSQEIADGVNEKMGRSRREFLLRQQLDEIKAKLSELKGEDDPEGFGVASDTEEDEISALSTSLLRVADAMPSEARQVAEREMRRLRQLNPMQPDYNVLRSYLEWMSELPWGVCTEDSADIVGARAQLDADHHGLEKIKDRIVEMLAVRQLRADNQGPILLFVGPPGVGKTSLGKSIAAALGRKFRRLSLGGVHDEAEVRGHRRT